jgi:hypothetical protein
MNKTFNTDFENTRTITITGDINQPTISIYRGSEYTFNFNLYDNYETDSQTITKQLSGNWGWEAYIGRLYGVSASPVISSTNFNNNLSAGLISVTFDASVSTLAVDMGSETFVNYAMDIWSRSGVDNVLVLQADLTFNNIAVEP